MSFKAKCDEYFESHDFYEILEVSRDASPAQIKKAYHKASLLVHPDRVPENQKDVATEKFKIISKVYSVLADQNKRSLYDETDTYDEEGCGADSISEWMETFRRLFKEVTRESIDKHKAEYINSPTELRDIKKSYLYCKGNMTKMHDMIPFLDCANEERIIGIVSKLVDAGELIRYDIFFNEPADRKKKRLQREKRNTLTPEQQDALFKENKVKYRQEAMDYAVFMSNLEAKYARPQPKKKKAAIKEAKGTAKNVKTGRITKRR